MIPHDLLAYWKLFVNSLPAELFVLVGIVAFAELLLFFFLYRFKKDKRILTLAMMTGYTFVVLYYTVFSRPTALQSTGNLMPFWSYMADRPEMTPLYLEKAMNIVLFIPIGLLGGYVFKSDKIIRNIVFCICFSISIEILQFLFKKGFSETDDVLHNVFGGIIGYCLYSFISKMNLDSR